MESSKDLSNYQDVISCLKARNTLVHSKFRYSIAKDIARLLTADFKGFVRDIKLYGSTAEYTAGIYSDIDIIIRVKSKSRNMEEMLKLLDTELCKEYFGLLSEDISEYCYLIDPKIINEDPLEPMHPSRSYLEYIFNNDSISLISN
jgi:predicted nucleotidyltransferase